ncbi:B12-binding domain-containing radical SAM protein [Phormidium sp. CLA17]|uniref:B12-binding domain-containing radical SAM protein n=1 Tax=Leptolyngbya sp. Cla-17 TaxID=2803751 RepID=UPI001491AFB5|nr:B12-binding domain-containing radical SAM protein [Leptolyngbya sp. Cla-17]MBM0742580.1 B12-binding domain-containing radical SAM protein [Leptolyngbya sp. Cla-17]
MRVLLLYPLFPKSFWSFEKALELVDRKAMLPPLGLVTVAALLPQEWEFRLVDRNVGDLTEADWEWAELAVMSAMIVQKEDFLHLIQEAKRHKVPIGVGGPYATALPHEAADADFQILDEGEITLPMFVAAVQRGHTQGVFRSDGVKPDVTGTPIPRFDLLNFDSYDSMSVQFSRGCPFQCEFCDIIVLYGRKPRTKTPQQLLAELECLYELGWRRSIFMVDDNFIGNKRNGKLMLRELKSWMASHGYPFRFNTEASIDLAQDQEMMDLMVECNFNAVFLGIETPDEASLTLTQKFQNTRDSLAESVDRIIRSGLRVNAGFIIGFDGEKKGAGERIVRFVEQTTVPLAMFSMLQALPDTALWHRLKKEGRMREQGANINQTTLMNFVPTRPLQDIANEFVAAFWELYDPERYLDRTYQHFLKLGAPKCPGSRVRKLNWVNMRALLILCWRQGVVRKTRVKFWLYLAGILRHNPTVWEHYLGLCALNEHFLEYRQVVQTEIEAQLSEYLATETGLQILPSLEEEKVGEAIAS